jgi:hypothetical protein
LRPRCYSLLWQLASSSTVADEIVATHPNLVLSRSTPATAALMHESLPIVFVLVAERHFAAMQFVAQYISRTSHNVRYESAIGSKADVTRT